MAQGVAGVVEFIYQRDAGGDVHPGDGLLAEMVEVHHHGPQGIAVGGDENVLPGLHLRRNGLLEVGNHPGDGVLQASCQRQLHLELTESAYTENPGQIITMVDELRRRGFVIEMDDFGSGYSSLNMLSQVRFDILKLDMQFIQTETAKPGEMSLMRFVVKLAKWMNLSTVAEGVETKAQVERLREVGCDYAQGYFFSRPLPVEKFEALMKQELAGGKTGHTH